MIQIKSDKEMIDNIFNDVSQAVGIHVMMLVIEHALWKTKQTYVEAEFITYSEEGIALESLNDLESDKAEAIVREFITMMVATLSRLVGQQLAQQLTQQLEQSIEMGAR